MQNDIKHQWFFNHPPQKVWNFITDSGLIAQWLMKNDFQPVVGHKFNFRTKPQKRFGFDGIVHCEVLEVLPLKRLSYSWKGGPGNGKFNLDSVVTWTLIPKESGTELVLEHTGFKGLRNLMTYFIMDRGWNGHIQKRLGALLNDTKNEKAIS